MDFLENAVLPQSAHHMVLLKYLLALTFLIVLPYFTLLIGSSLLSVYYNSKSKRSDNTYYSKFSKQLIDLVTFNKSMSFGFGVVPILSAIFCYAQLLHMTDSGVPQNIFISLIFFLTGIVLIYTYKYSSHINDILGKIKDSDEESDIYKLKAVKLLNKTGKYGLVLLLVSAYLFIGSIELAIDSSRWGEDSSLLGIILSINTLTYFLYFIAASISVTSAVLLYFYFRPNYDWQENDPNYKSFVKKFALTRGLIATLILPALIVLNVFVTPAVALNGIVFGSIVIILFIVLLIANLFYLMLKESNTKFSSSVIYLFVILFTFLVIKEQAAFSTSTQNQFQKLSANYEEYRVKLNEELGIETVAVSGEDIFNGRCSACHKFDVKLVGPPYNSVLSKYVGKQDELAKFVLNPVKINPDYPVMPNQGLKPNEAKAIAEYILKVYQENQN
ncbi:MAG: hypothetical protein KJ571_10340 [Bacteroidetes bacterium]|nr:hypothetical protein [Bacteroidota bacterium]